MAERTTITEGTQVGKETTPGTAVAANKKLLSLGLTLTPKLETTVFKPSGNKFPTLAVPGKEWVEGELSGNADYNEVIYALSMLLGAVTPTVPGGTTPREWLWNVAASAAADPQTFTVERGSSVRAEKAAYVAAQDLSFTITREGIEIGGALIGQKLDDGISMTGSPTSAALQPCLPTEVSVYADTTWAQIGNTKLLRVLEADVGLSGRFGQLWPLDAAVPSFLGLFEAEPKSELKIVQVADAAGMAHLARARAGTVVYIRVKVEGPVIETTYKYLLQFDIPAKVTDWGYGDQDGLKTAEWTFEWIADATAGYPAKILVRNVMTAL